MKPTRPSACRSMELYAEDVVLTWWKPFQSLQKLTTLFMSAMSVLKYCGKDSYLISQITYNIPKPNEIENQLTFNSNNQIMVKHEDGRVNFINGTLNKRTLYGYN